MIRGETDSRASLGSVVYLTYDETAALKELQNMGVKSHM